MKEISKYIEELLYHHQCVIIPELGAFITNRLPAVINHDKTISPPRKTISFNSRLTSNDGVLINYISKKENINYESAQIKVHKFVEDCKSNLKNGHFIKIANLGNLTLEGENRLKFSPSDNINLLTDSFGMTTIIPQEAILTEEEKQAPIHNSKEMSKVGTKTRNISKSKGNSLEYLKYVAIIILGISVLSYGILTSFYSKEDSSINNIVVDSESIQKELESKISEATFLSGSPLELPSLTLHAVKKTDSKPVKAEKENTDLNYHVIAGAFSSRENAETKVQQLRKEGYKSNIVARSRSGLYQVCYQSFETQAEAEAFNREIRTNRKLDSWVLSTK